MFCAVRASTRVSVGSMIFQIYDDFAPLVWARCSVSYISLKAAQKGLNLENGMPIKCERGTKCYFVPRALKSKLTKCRPPWPFFLSVAVLCQYKSYCSQAVFSDLRRMGGP